ncbi:MAG TPA: EAL domain-containing protein [Usitatibacteraceae bacterium]|nr:EAL domain-containing protein [Usitatibacteraceae bacterium]
MREALRANQLEVHYQPKINLATGNCNSVEGLLRWNASGHGHIPPGVIIRLAEASGLIGALTTWIANTIVRHQGEWRRSGIDISSSINLSTINLADSDLPDVFGQIIGTWRADPTLITLEITESSTIGDEEHSLAVLRRLKELGIKLSVDDFGTGYSSLSYVKRFPLDELKIDRLFVQHMLNSATDQAIVRSVLDLARNFNLSVVAEGVEDAGTLEALQQMGCHYAQGFHISRAIPPAALLEWIERWNRR